MKKLVLEYKQPSQTCTLFFGTGVFPQVSRFTAEGFPDRRPVVIADATVAKLYGQKLIATFQEHGITPALISFPPGEASKCRKVKAELEESLLSQSFGRDTLVIALGGGVTGDLAGFVAATFCRGVPVIQVPTTVLAMADSSIGGKTGIDVPAGKNLIGAFHQPEAVFMDPLVLQTLSDRDIRAGMVEIIKHGMIFDASLFEAIAAHPAELTRPAEHAELFNDILFKSCSIKGEVVRQDERESGMRQILNFGHTVGHAVESLANWRLLHGEAVSVGIAAALLLSEKRCGFPGPEKDRVIKLLETFKTPVAWEFTIADALKIMQHDKKVRHNTCRFVLLERIGSVARTGTWTHEVPQGLLVEALRATGGTGTGTT